MLDVHRQYTPLRILLDAAQSPALASRQPRLYEHVLELLYILAAGGCSAQDVEFKAGDLDIYTTTLCEHVLELVFVSSAGGP